MSWARSLLAVDFNESRVEFLNNDVEDSLQFKDSDWEIVDGGEGDEFLKYSSLISTLGDNGGGNGVSGRISTSLDNRKNTRT